MLGDGEDVVSTLQGSILPLVYPWYANTEHNGRKAR